MGLDSYQAEQTRKRYARGKKKRRERLARARERGTHTKEQWLAMVRYCGGTCVRCEDEDAPVVLDHITPIYYDDESATDSIENIQPLCHRCNCQKGPEDIDHRPDGWREAVFGA